MSLVCVLVLCLAGSGCSSTGGMVVGGLFQWFGENAAYKQGASSNDHDWARDAGF
jgi:hypothetical protein